ncbi:APC family permease [Aminipila sp.]|uniref:APC family permease n=1 Tax=Aminipila sp. TaxID=2060095 RepID=UPI00289B5E6F|nr:APC family permease [Aminipila sp.]
MGNDNTVMLEQPVELKRVLKLPTLVCQGLAYLCPASVLFYFGIVNDMTGGNFPLVLIITTFAMLLSALSYAKMSKRYPVAGSVYSYVSKAINPKLGFIAGWTIMLDYFLLPMTCYLSCGLYLNVALPLVPIWVWIFVTVIFVTFCNYRGVEVAAFMNNINTIFPIVVVIVTLVFIIRFVIGGGGTGTLLYAEGFYNPDTIKNPAIFSAAAMMAIVFVGFDSVTTYSEETINPEKMIGRAVVIICLGAGIGFIIVAYIMNCGWPTAVREMANPNTAIIEYYAYIGVDWMNSVFIVLNTLACIGCCIAGQAATTRILLGMGRDGFFSKKFFGYIHPKYQTPSKNILLTSAVGLTAVIFQDNLAEAISLVSFGALAGFIFTNVTVIFQYYIKEHQRNLKGIITFLIMPIIGTIVCVYLWFSLTIQAKIVGFSWLALGIIFLTIKTKGFKELPPELEL